MVSEVLELFVYSPISVFLVVSVEHELIGSVKVERTFGISTSVLLLSGPTGIVDCPGGKGGKLRLQVTCPHGSPPHR
jgi:hypothetical protein